MDELGPARAILIACGIGGWIYVIGYALWHVL